MKYRLQHEKESGLVLAQRALFNIIGFAMWFTLSWYLDFCYKTNKIIELTIIMPSFLIRELHVSFSQYYTLSIR